MDSPSKISKNILKCQKKRRAIWFGRTKFATRHEDRLRARMREIDLIQDRLFAQLWEAYYDYPEDLEVVYKQKDPWGRLRITYCDLQFHLVTDKQDNFIYGYECNCN